MTSRGYHHRYNTAALQSSTAASLAAHRWNNFDFSLFTLQPTCLRSSSQNSVLGTNSPKPLHKNNNKNNNNNKIAVIGKQQAKTTSIESESESSIMKLLPSTGLSLGSLFLAVKLLVVVQPARGIAFWQLERPQHSSMQTFLSGQQQPPSSPSSPPPPTSASESYSSSASTSNSSNSMLYSIRNGSYPSPDSVIAAVKTIYETRNVTEQRSNFEAFYSDGATFEDPIMIVKGLNNIKVQFHAVIKAFNPVSYRVNGSRWFSHKECIELGLSDMQTLQIQKPPILNSLNNNNTDTATNRTPPLEMGDPCLVIDNVQTYSVSISKTGKPSTLELPALTILIFDSQSGLIKSHFDVWKDHFPIILDSRMYQNHFVKRTVALLTTFFFKLAGW